MAQLPELHPRTVRPTERSPRAQNPDAQSRGTRDNDVRLRNVEPPRVPLGRAAPNPPQVLDSLYRLVKNNRTDHPISYQNTLIKTGSESTGVMMRRRRILFAGFVARMEDTRLPKCVMFGELVGSVGCVGGQKKEGMWCFLDDLRAFGINADHWTTAAQDEGGWRKTAEQGVERFMAKRITAAKSRAELRHAVVCPNVTGRTKERKAQSKRARAGSFAIGDLPQVARICILRAHVVVLFCFVFVFFASIEAAALHSTVLRYACAPTATRSYLTTVCVLFRF